MESVMFIESPTRLHHAGDLALTGQFAETNPANLKPPNEGAPTTAILAAIVLARPKFRRPTCFDH
jgi:hypothetical protein